MGCLRHMQLPSVWKVNSILTLVWVFLFLYYRSDVSIGRLPLGKTGTLDYMRYLLEIVRLVGIYPSVQVSLIVDLLNRGRTVLLDQPRLLLRILRSPHFAMIWFRPFLVAIPQYPLTKLVIFQKKRFRFNRFLLLLLQAHIWIISFKLSLFVNKSLLYFVGEGRWWALVHYPWQFLLRVQLLSLLLLLFDPSLTLLLHFGLYLLFLYFLVLRTHTGGCLFGLPLPFELLGKFHIPADHHQRLLLWLHGANSFLNFNLRPLRFLLPPEGLNLLPLDEIMPSLAQYLSGVLDKPIPLDHFSSLEVLKSNDKFFLTLLDILNIDKQSSHLSLLKFKILNPLVDAKFTEITNMLPLQQKHQPLIVVYTTIIFFLNNRKIIFKSIGSVSFYYLWTCMLHLLVIYYLPSFKWLEFICSCLCSKSMYRPITPILSTKFLEICLLDVNFRMLSGSMIGKILIMKMINFSVLLKCPNLESILIRYRKASSKLEVRRLPLQDWNRICSTWWDNTNWFLHRKMHAWPKCRNARRKAKIPLKTPQSASNCSKNWRDPPTATKNNHKQWRSKWAMPFLS